jgi:hypothetical protein
MISAAAGGTLVGGGASLLVPAGALEADRMITLSISAPMAGEPGAADIMGNVYDLGPSGTTFKVPVALTLPLAGTVPADKKAVVVWQEPSSGQWIPLASTVSMNAVSGLSEVTGLTTHFTRFAVMVLAKDAVCPYAGGCGGSLVGTWKYNSSCIKAMESKAFDCGTAGAVNLRTEYLVGGTATFTADRYTVSHTIMATGTLFYTPACMEVLRQSMPTADCATLQTAWRMQGSMSQAWVCSGTVQQGCSCVITNGINAAPIMGSYVVNGSQVTFTQDGKSAGMPDEFCVKGSSLTVKDAEDGSVTTAVKQ